MEARIGGKGREEAGRGQPQAGRAPQHMRLLGCGREQQRKAGMVGRRGRRSRGLSSGEQRQKERRGMGEVGEGCCVAQAEGAAA